MRLKWWYVDFFWVKGVIIGRFIGLSDRTYVSINLKVVWVLKISPFLMMHFWQTHTWRLLHDTNSLFYHVFKAKLFPNTSVMEAKIPANASCAWRSIMRGRDVIKRGSRWRISSGNSVHISGDNWLPIKANLKLLSPHIEDSTITLVNDLIDHEQKIWREDVSEKSFYPFEVSIIKSIPLYRTIQEDVLIWPFNPDGI